jgi:hypothetical protein
MDPELFDQFVTETGKRIAHLKADATKARGEAAKYRVRLREVETELAALKAELGK